LTKRQVQIILRTKATTAKETLIHQLGLPRFKYSSTHWQILVYPEERRRASGQNWKVHQQNRHDCDLLSYVRLTFQGQKILETQRKANEKIDFV